MSYYPPQQRSAPAAPRYHPPMPSQTAFRPAPGLGHVTVSGGNFSRFQSPAYPEETASVSSQLTFPAHPSQTDCLRNEISEIARGFSQITSQELARIQDAIQAAKAENPMSQWYQTLENTLQQAQELAATTAARHMSHTEERAQSDFAALKTSIETGLNSISSLMKTLIKEKTAAWKQLNVLSRNIEERIQNRKMKKKSLQKNEKRRLCRCLLQGVKGMKKRERAAALASGSLVCTCRT